VGKDITFILDGWDFEPGKISVRKVIGQDKLPKIQLRLDLGLLQMETTGRPDGRRPHGCESLLHYYRRRLEAQYEADAKDFAFELSPRDCEAIRAEAMMYYHRYLSEFALEEYDAVVRDTQRNLDALELCRRYARTDSDRMAMEQYRPYILMMHTRAKAMASLEKDDFASARHAVQEGLSRMRAFGEEVEQLEAMEHSPEVAVLRSLLEEIEQREPVDPVRATEASLAQALADERYEDAARIRDRLRLLKDGGSQ
jgi:hypothetical protein